MVWPDIEVTISPGFVARPLGMFSQVGTMTVTLTGAAASARAASVPSTVAAPLMSNFISSMPGGSFSEMPPVSNVIPLPIRTIGGRAAGAPRYSATIRRGGSSLPRVTDRNEPILSRLISAGPRTRTLIRRWPRARRLAALPR